MNADLETQIIELNNNPAFCALRKKFAQDTIFDILGATNRELVNSRFFAWLLDPNGFHNLGTKGVKKLLECIYIKSENKEKKDLLKGFLLGKNAIKNVIIRCEESFKNKKTKEKSRFDIFINIEYKDKDKEDEILKIIIENKYDAPESPGQTEKYEELLKEERSDNIETIGVFLSAHADEADAHDDERHTRSAPGDFHGEKGGDAAEEEVQIRHLVHIAHTFENIQGVVNVYGDFHI